MYRDTASGLSGEYPKRFIIKTRRNSATTSTTTRHNDPSTKMSRDTTPYMVYANSNSSCKYNTKLLIGSSANTKISIALKDLEQHDMTLRACSAIHQLREIRGLRENGLRTAPLRDEESVELICSMMLWPLQERRAAEQALSICSGKTWILDIAHLILLPSSHPPCIRSEQLWNVDDDTHTVDQLIESLSVNLINMAFPVMCG